jgi:hypothetical protein
VDWVHGVVDRRRGRVHSGPTSGADNGDGGASSTHCTHALELTGALRRWPRRTSKTRRCGGVLAVA